MTKTNGFSFRVATLADRQPIGDLHVLSMRRLGATFYEDDTIEAFLALGAIDDALLSAGTYYVVEAGRTIVATGGWSTRRAGFESRRATAAPTDETEGANVRGVFVHPDFSRCGIARRMMNRIESEIVDAGFRGARLTSTLSGIPFYRSLGWRSGPPAVLNLPGDLIMVGLDMAKHLLPTVGTGFHPGGGRPEGLSQMPIRDS